GYGVRRFGGGRSYPRFLVLSIAVALVCTIVAVPVNILVYEGAFGHAVDDLAATMVEVGQGIWLALFSANLLASLVDKLIASFLGLLLARLLAPLRLNPDLPQVLPIAYPGVCSRHLRKGS